MSLNAVVGPHDLFGEHLLEALKLRSGEKSIGIERVFARHS